MCGGDEAFSIGLVSFLSYQARSVPQLLSCLLSSLVEHNFLAQRGNWEEDDHRTHPAHHVVHLSEVRNLLKEPPSGSGPDDVVCRAVDIVFNTAAAFAE